MRGQALLLLPILVLLVAGSGSADTPKFTALHATRTIRPQFHLDPFDVTVRDMQTIQRLYEAALALPAVEPGATYFCPLSIGLVYHLDFLAHDFPVLKMSLEATGCRFLSIGQDDTRIANDPAFFDEVAQLVGLPTLVPHFPGQLAP